MDFFDLLQKRRSVRDYEDKEIALDLIKEIINDSIKAPNASHLQPWKFIIINNREWMKRISDSSKSVIIRGVEKNPNSPMKGYAAMLKKKDYNVFYNAPCLVLITGPEKSATSGMDVGLLACYFMFSATSRGLGTCWCALGAEIRDPNIQKEIGLPEGHRVIAPLILGYPKSIPSMPPRREPQILRIIS